MKLPRLAAAALALSLIAAAPPSGPVKVGTPDRRAAMGGGKSLDPASPCAELQTKTLAELPACQAKLDRGDSAAALHAAALMMLRGNANFDPGRAEALLRHAIAVENHPAVHYLLGVALGTGEVVPPRYAEARVELEKARTGGNPAATDLLGTLWLRGQGGPQDVGRALESYEEALAGGFAEALNNLLDVDLTGRWTPPNPKRVEALLAAAEAAGYPNAVQARAMVAGSAKISNVQTIPPTGDGPPTTVVYTGFEGPELPQSIGFDAAFQKIYRAPFDDPAIVADLKARLATLPTPYIFELARRIAPADPREALTLYVLARVRMAYDGARCADPTSAQGAAGWNGFIAAQIRFALPAGPVPAAVLTEVLARDAALGTGAAPSWICYHGIGVTGSALKSQRPAQVYKPVAEWPTIHASVRAQLTAVK